MSVSWSDALGQHPAKQAASAVRSATGLPAGTTPTRGSTNAPTARAFGAGSQNTGLLYSPSSPRMRVPLATAHAAHSAAKTSPSAHRASRSAAVHRTDERSSAHHDARSPEETARDELRRKLTNPTSDSGATSQRSTSNAATSQQSKPRRRAREPRAVPQSGALEHVAPRGSSLQHGKARPRKAKPYCGNNKKASGLLDGSERVGRPSECIQRGFGAALHQPVENVEAFVRMHSGPYEKLIDPQLWFKNSEPPHGMQRATLPMCFQKGFGAGTAALARKLREKHGLNKAA